MAETFLQDQRKLVLPPKFKGLFKPAPFKIAYGGRGAAKSQSYARGLIANAYDHHELILCTREYQNSIKNSVYRLLWNIIEELELYNFFEKTEATIRCKRGKSKSEFIFNGLRRNIDEIKSTEGITKCWIEEGQSVSRNSVRVLFPTIRGRKGGPPVEIWITFNPLDAKAPIYELAQNPPPGSWVQKVGWEDNPYLTKELNDQRLLALSIAEKTGDFSEYDHVWGGEPLTISEAVIFKGRYVVEEFDTPEDARFFHGLDFGFGPDPLAFTRSFMNEAKDEIFIDREVFGYGIELDSMPRLLEQIPTAKVWPIKADGSRPETIAFLAKRGFTIRAARKWQGSVMDGIAYLKSFKKIHIHKRCVNMAMEASKYSHDIDENTEEILPTIVDKFNHGWDSVRYALDGYVRQIGQGAIVIPFVYSKEREVQLA